MKKVLYISSLLLIISRIYAQDTGGFKEIIKAEAQLSSMFETLYNEELMGSNMALYRKTDSLFQEALEMTGSFDYKWQKLSQIGKLTSEDGVMKVFSWMYMEDRNTYHYSAFIQISEKNGEVDIFKLEPSASKEILSEEFPQEIGNWHGKIYYDLVTTEAKRKTLYTLMGADFNNVNSTVKTIEVISIQRGKPVFRDDQFLDGGKVKDRVVFEYSSNVAVSLRYNSNLDMIVFDHLAPLHPIYTGNYQFYGPDGSYDGFRFTDGIWIKVEDLDARNL